MEKLYLVRRSIETYIGPLRLSELRNSYKRMEFGLQDEVAGNRGEWVALDDLKKLKTIYPEVAKLVSDELLGGWGISEHSQKKLIRPKAKVKTKPRGQNTKLFLILFFVFGAGSALYFSGRYRSLPGMSFFQKSDPSSLASLVENEDFAAFDKQMERILPKLLPKVKNSRNLYNQWIPYLRLLAFQRDGELPGLNAKLLRGMGKFAAPNDCSYESWQRRWKSGVSEWGAFDGRVAPSIKSDWARLLLWDSNWMYRRRGAMGWKKISHYYEACLLMARKALINVREQETISADKKNLAQGFIDRMSFQIDLTHGVRTYKVDTFLPKVLEVSTCIESATSQAALTACKKSNVKNQRWIDYLTWGEARQKMFIHLHEKASLNDQQLSDLRKIHHNLKNIDPLTEFSYQAELQYFVAILLNNGSLSEARKQVGYEFPEVSFAH